MATTKPTTSDRPTVYEVNCKTGVAAERPMTDAEYEQYLLDAT
jgi:hypothetical protein